MDLPGSLLGRGLHPAPPERSGGAGRALPGWTSRAAAVADGESRVAVGVERNPPGGWRKQSPQLSVEEGGHSPGAGESSAFKAVPPCAPRHPCPGEVPPRPGTGLTSFCRPGTAVLRWLSQWDRGAPSPARSCAGVCAAARGCSAALPRATSPWGPNAAHPGKGEGVRTATLAEAKWTGSEVEGRGQGHLTLVKKRILRVCTPSAPT